MLYNEQLLKISELTNMDLILLGIIMLLAITVAFLHRSVDTKNGSHFSKHSDILIISINQDSNILFNDKIVEKNSIASELCKYERNINICIDCTKQTKFDMFITLLNIIKEKNFHHLSIKPRKA